MYHVDCWGLSKVEGVVVVVCVLVCDEGCEVRVVVYIEDGDWVKKEVG